MTFLMGEFTVVQDDSRRQSDPYRDCTVYQRLSCSPADLAEVSSLIVVALTAFRLSDLELLGRLGVMSMEFRAVLSWEHDQRPE